METQKLHLQPNPILPLHLDHLHLDAQRSLHVVRDDLLPAGTKQRAVLPLLRDLMRQGHVHMIYASPFAGFAQVALAYGCHALGLRCTLFCERDATQTGIQPHPFTRLAEKWGAEIVLVNDLEEAEDRANDLCDSGQGFKIPLGFHCREFQHHFQRAVEEALTSIRHQIGFLPSRVWLPVGSGTLTQAFRKAAPASTQLCCVDVRVLKGCDLRIQAIRSLPRVQYFAAPETFAEQAKRPPPLPSNIHYDAKLWAFVNELAQDGDLWWNVAR